MVRLIQVMIEVMFLYRSVYSVDNNIRLRKISVGGEERMMDKEDRMGERG